jgi:hypothetical protein
MAKKPRKTDDGVLDYRYDVKRKNIPPAGLAARGKILAEAKVRYSYNPHLAPTLRFDATGREDGLPELLREALRRPLSGAQVLMPRQVLSSLKGKRIPRLKSPERSPDGAAPRSPPVPYASRDVLRAGGGCLERGRLRKVVPAV